MKVSIEMLHNKPNLIVNGQAVLPVLYGLSDIPASKSNTVQAARNIAAFARTGIHLVNVDTGIHLGWHKKEQYDPSAVLAEIENAVSADPDELVLVRLHMNPPYWWLRDHPEECVIYRTPEGDVGGIDNGEQDRLIANDAKHHIRVSLASDLWQEQASECLEKLCEAIRKSDVYNHFLGFQIACGIYGEWHQWGIDVSQPMVQAFRNDLINSYENEEALQRAWNDPGVTFESASFHPENFQSGDHGNFRDPKISRSIIDAQNTLQSSAPKAILRFCRVVKEHLPDRLAGTFYGYYFNVGLNNAVIGGHLRPDLLFAHREWIDFLCGPMCYLDNRLSTGVPMQRGLLESVRLHGMLWLTEMDQHPECVREIGGDERKFPETISVLRRNVMQPLCAGHGLWYYDHRVIPSLLENQPQFAKLSGIYYKVGWWENEKLRNEIAQLNRIAEEMLLCDYQPRADVLIVCSCSSFFVRSQVTDPEYVMFEAVSRCSVAYDCIEISDLKLADLDRYRCIIFVNQYDISEEESQKIRSLTEGKTCLFFGAPGYVTDSGFSVENISHTVGMHIKESTDHSKVIGQGLFEGIEVEKPEKFWKPCFLTDDPEVTVLAKTVKGNVVAAQKGTNIWCGPIVPDCRAMKKIFTSAGVHCYSNMPDTIFAGSGILVVNSIVKGERMIFFHGGKKVSCYLNALETAIFSEATGKRIR